MAVRNMDWMATAGDSTDNGAWFNFTGSGPYQLNGNTLVGFALTSPPIVANQNRLYGQFEANDHWYCERVKGQVLVSWDSQSVASYDMLLDCRIITAPVTLSGTPVVDPSYDLSDPYFADESFLYHGSLFTTRISGWTTVEQAKHETVFEIDCKTRRKMDEKTAVCMFIQSLGANGGTVPRTSWVNRLRVLGSSIS